MQLLEPGRCASQAPGHPHPQSRRAELLRPHAEQHSRCAAEDAHRILRKPPAGRRIRPDSRSAAAVHGRFESHHAEEINEGRN